MPFVEINGFPIPIVDAGGTELSYVETGDARRGLGGTFTKHRRYLRRRWRFRTPPLSSADALAIRSLLRGEGFGLPFTARTRTSNTGTHEISATADSQGQSSPQRYADDGVTVQDAAKVGDGSITVDPARQNLAPNDLADGTDGGFVLSAVPIDGAVLVSDPARFVSGTRSLRTTTSAAVNGVRGGFSGVAASAPVAPATTVAASLYLFCLAGASIGVRLRDVTNAIDGAEKFIAVPADTWVRIKDVTVTTGALAATVYVEVREAVADSGLVFFADNFQCEARPYSTAWVHPSFGARAAGALLYPPTVAQASALDGWTFSAWASRPYFPATCLLAMVRRSGALPGDYITLEAPASDLVRFRLVNAALGVTDLDSAPGVLAALGDSGWLLVTACFHPTPPAGRYKAELWINGTRVAFASPATLPALTDLSSGQFSIGCHSSGPSFPWAGGAINDPVVLPRQALAAEIAAWYTSGRRRATMPKLEARGDFAPGEMIEALGVVLGGAAEQHHAADGAWRTTGRAVEFELHEV